jgi:hypothetical protein
MAATRMTESTQALVACLLPVRNCARHLPDWFETVRPLADTVIALDDGSTDDSVEVLARSDLVDVLLRNPRRDSYREWDDAANRNRDPTSAGHALSRAKPNPRSRRPAMTRGRAATV